MRLFLKKRVISERFWVPQPDWQQTCTKRNVQIIVRPYETLIGLAYNKGNQLVQITKNSLSTAFIFYVTLLEQDSFSSIILNKQSSMSIKHIRTEIKDTHSSSEFELLDLYVRKEGIGERGMLLEALIYDLRNQYDNFNVHGNFEHISYSGKISLECFTQYGFKLINDQLIYSA